MDSYPRITLPDIARHYHFDQVHDCLLDSPVTTYMETVQAKVVDMTDRLIVNAILAEARDNGIDDLYLIDKKFILEAIAEKLERMKGEKYDVLY